MDTDLKPVLLAFILVIMAVAFIGAIADSATSATQLNTATNETTALTNTSAASLDHNQLASVTSVIKANNASIVIAAANYTADLDQGTIRLINGVAGDYNVTYTYYEVKDSTSRTLISFNVLFFALATLLMAIGILYPLYKKMM